ncbi:MAG: type II secretion system protein GspE, partial [Planctomycetota bacterium]|nr:type II secretion system protein GspE [Planctomycetota bacterium]
PEADLLEKAGLNGEHGFARGRGCEACHHTGFAGRTAIYEILPVDDGIRRQFLEDPSTTSLREMARKRKMTTLRERGIELACQGRTSLDEILRETQGDTD